VSEIAIDRTSMDRLMAVHVTDADAIDTVLGTLPDAVDGGIASAIIGFLVSATAEASGVVSDSYRALAAITVDVLDDMSLTDEQIGDEFESLQHEIDG
jgi:hypothetical protein